MDERLEKSKPFSPTSPNPAQDKIPLAAIQQAIADVRHGIVQIIIQDGRVIQIDKTEKIRLV